MIDPSDSLEYPSCDHMQRRSCESELAECIVVITNSCWEQLRASEIKWRIFNTESLRNGLFILIKYLVVFRRIAGHLINMKRDETIRNEPK